jgi:hypothetical protein
MTLPNHPISPGYAPNPDADLTTPIRRPNGLGHTIAMDMGAVRTAAPVDYQPDPAPHPVNLIPSHRARRPRRPRPVAERVETTGVWQIGVGLLASHVTAALIGAAVTAAIFTDWSSW